MQFKAVIIEDEPISRRAMRRMVDSVNWLTCVGEAGTVKSAIATINTTRPDVVFLDVKMPGGSGLDVLEAAVFIPNIIFTTAFSDFAVDAFDHNAVDYLLKPFSTRRFDAAIEKLHKRLFDNMGQKQIDSITVFVSSGNKLLPLTIAEVECFSACDDYVLALNQGGERVLNTTLAALEKELDPSQFIRIHRSHLVNMRYVHRMQKHGDRKLRLRMRSGAELVSSRSGTKKLQNFLR